MLSKKRVSQLSVNMRGVIESFRTRPIVALKETRIAATKECVSTLCEGGSIIAGRIPGAGDNVDQTQERDLRGLEKQSHIAPP